MQQVARQEMLSSYAKSFKYFNVFMLWMWRLGLGKFINIAPKSIGQMMVLVHTGRKSNKTRYTPLNYALIDNQIYCMAGFGKQAQWYKNIMAKPEVEIWSPEGWWAGHVSDVTSDTERVHILRSVLIASGFAAPLLEGIHPHDVSDAELDDLCEKYDYRLLRIQHVADCTGVGGPGEYAWVWSLLSLLLLFRLWRKK